MASSLERQKGKGKATPEDGTTLSAPSRKRVRFAGAGAEASVDDSFAPGSGLSFTSGRVCSLANRGRVHAGAPTSSGRIAATAFPDHASGVGDANRPDGVGKGLLEDRSSDKQMSSDDLSRRITVFDHIASAMPTDATTFDFKNCTAVPASDHERGSPSQSLEGSDPPSSISFEASVSAKASSDVSRGLAIQLPNDLTDLRWGQDNATCASSANDGILSPDNGDSRGGDGDEKPHEVRSVSMNESLMQQMEDLISMVPRLQLERSRSEMEIIMKRKHVLGSFLGTPKSGKSPQIILPRTRSF